METKKINKINNSENVKNENLKLDFSGEKKEGTPVRKPRYLYTVIDYARRITGKITATGNNIHQLAEKIKSENKKSYGGVMVLPNPAVGYREEDITHLERIVIDIDTEFSKVVEVLEKLRVINPLFDELYTLEETSSGNARIVFELVRLDLQKLSEEKRKKTISIAKAVVENFITLLGYLGLNVDRSFKNINHQVFVPGLNSLLKDDRRSKLIKVAAFKIELIELYRITKSFLNAFGIVNESVYRFKISQLKKSIEIIDLQLSGKLPFTPAILPDEVKSRLNLKNLDLDKYGDYYKQVFSQLIGEESDKNNTVDITELTLEDLYNMVEKAYENFYKKKTGKGRFLGIMLPFTSIAYELGFKDYEIAEVLKEKLPDKVDDIEYALKYADPDRFKYAFYSKTRLRSKSKNVKRFRLTKDQIRFLKIKRRYLELAVKSLEHRFNKTRAENKFKLLKKESLSRFGLAYTILIEIALAGGEFRGEMKKQIEERYRSFGILEPGETILSSVVFYAIDILIKLGLIEKYYDYEDYVYEYKYKKYVQRRKKKRRVIAYRLLYKSDDIFKVFELFADRYIGSSFGGSKSLTKLTSMYNHWKIIYKYGGIDALKENYGIIAPSFVLVYYFDFITSKFDIVESGGYQEVVQNLNFLKLKNLKKIENPEDYYRYSPYYAFYFESEKKEDLKKIFDFEKLEYLKLLVSKAEYIYMVNPTEENYYNYIKVLDDYHAYIYGRRVTVFQKTSEEIARFAGKIKRDVLKYNFLINFEFVNNKYLDEFREMLNVDDDYKDSLFETNFEIYSRDYFEELII